MAVSFGRRISIMAGVMLGVLALVVPASPASAQAGGPGAQASPINGVTANCPTAVAANQVTGTFASGPFTVGFPAAGSCSSFSANSQGSYTGGGSAPLPFSSSCQTAGLQTGGGVDVPAGTVVNPGTPGQFTTGAVQTITTPNTVVRFPNGTVATLNVVSTTATTVTRTAIQSGGTNIGQVVCGAAVYPLAVETAAGASPAPLSPLTSSGDDGGISTAALLAGAFALAVAAQLAIGRRVWRRKADATG